MFYPEVDQYLNACLQKEEHKYVRLIVSYIPEVNVGVNL